MTVPRDPPLSIPAPREFAALRVRRACVRWCPQPCARSTAPGAAERPPPGRAWTASGTPHATWTGPGARETAPPSHIPRPWPWPRRRWAVPLGRGTVRGLGGDRGRGHDVARGGGVVGPVAVVHEHFGVAAQFCDGLFLAPVAEGLDKGGRGRGRGGEGNAGAGGGGCGWEGGWLMGGRGGGTSCPAPWPRLRVSPHARQAGASPIHCLCGFRA